jgi:hypothetical protein
VVPITAGSRPLDGVAVGWGALAASIGLMIGSGRDWPLRLAITAAFFTLGGLLAGVRAVSRRRLHALAAGVAAYVIDGAFVGLAALIAPIDDLDAPDLIPGGLGRWAVTALWSLAFAFLGGLAADAWLRPAPRRRRTSA